ncbi:uncharacterized protein V6R79_000015 [Siganus canaliculatus]
MSSTNQDEANVNISPVLFMSVDGESLCFFLRPGPIKRRLQPLITAGGGTLCNMQRPGAILLMDPEEIGSITTATAHWFVSTQYIHDCIKKSEQLNIEDYRLNPDVIPKQSPKHYSNKGSPTGPLSGRVAYTAEEDAAILSYVSKHKSETGGNRLWQDMEKKRVTNHSWQSMKYRYRVRLAKKQPEVAEVTAADEAPQAAVEEMMVEENHEAEEENPSTAEHAASPQNHSSEADVTQMDTRDNSAEDKLLDDGEAQTSICPQGEEQHVNPQADIQPDVSTELEPVEAETSDTIQPGLEPPADTQPGPAENAEPETETEEPQTVMSPQKESTSKDLEPPEPKSQTSPLSQKKPEEKQKNSPQQPQRRVTRRKPEESLPQPYAKKLRSSRQSPSPQPPKKVARKSAAPKDVTDNQLSPKKAKGSSVEAVVESQPEESSSAPVCEAAAAAESVSKPQMGGKRKEKRKLGILEMATKEFEDESESDEDQAPDHQNPTQSVTKSSTSTKDHLPTPAVAASTQSQSPPSAAEAAAAPSRAHLFIFDSESQEDSQSVVGVGAAAPADQHKDKTAASLTNQSEDGETPDLSNPAETVTIQPASTEPEPGPSLQRNVPETPAGAEAVTAPSRPHHFIFDSESQEDSQSILGAGSAAPADQQKNKAAASLTQDQLEEDKQRIRALMKETKQVNYCPTDAAHVHFLLRSCIFPLAQSLVGLYPALFVSGHNHKH